MYIGEAFTSLWYDWGLTTLVLSNREDSPLKFNVGKTVYVQDQETWDIFEATVVTTPTKCTPHYTICLQDRKFEDINLEDMYMEYNILSSGKPSISMGFFWPNWLQHDQKVTLLHDNVYWQGYLNINDDSLWEFFTLDKEGHITFCTDLDDIKYSWKMRIKENSFDVGW